MTFWEIFVRVLPWRPFAALIALWWHVGGRRLRARNQLRTAGAQLPFAYKVWQKKIEGQQRSSSSVSNSVANLQWNPSFLLLLMVDESHSQADVTRSVQSFEQQSYRNFSIVTEKSERGFAASALERIVEETSADFVVPVQAGNQLCALALRYFAEVLQHHSAAAILYGDQDEADAKGTRTNPWFKPNWNEELFLAQNYLADAAAFHVQRAREALARSSLVSSEPIYELLLKIASERTAEVIHIPFIITHVATDRRKCRQSAKVEVIAKHVERLGATAQAGAFGTVRVVWPLPVQKPLVSIIIPTKDKVDLLKACVESVLARTTYEPFEILVVDNGSVEKRTIAYLSRLKGLGPIRVLAYPGPYNFSAINNFAAGYASGSYLCLLNNDTEVIDKQWLTELMRYAVKPEIGAAGAKLLYADQTIQHAGVVIGIGEAAGHAHRNQAAMDEGYFGQAHVAHYVSAVTGACLVVNKGKFMAVGGLDENCLAVAFNDIDFCLKLERAGWRNVYVPHAVLIHHESKSRGKDHSRGQIHRYRRELKTFQERWNAVNYQDPLFNPNLDRSSETFIIRL